MCAAVCLSAATTCPARGFGADLAADWAMVHGSVTNLLTGTPVSGAKVMMVPVDGSSPPITVTTEDSGLFSLQSLAPGQYRLWVERSGFEAQQFGAKSANADGSALSLSSGQAVSNVAIRLLPHGSLSGTVSDSDGNPVSGAQIQAIRLIAGPVPVMQAVAWATTGNFGEYRIGDIAPGLYYLLATPAPPRVGKSTEALAPAYYPDSPDLARALRLAAPAGTQTRDVDFLLHRVRSASVRGRVIDLSGNGLSDSLRLVLTPQVAGCAGSTNVRQLQVDIQSGRFVADGVSPGEYVLTAMERDSDAVLEGRTTLDVGDSDLNDVDLPLTAGVTLKGRIVFESQGPHATDNLQVTLTALDSLAMKAGLTSVASPEGLEFQFNGVIPGVWALDVSGLPEGAYIRSISAGGRDLPDRKLDVSDAPPGFLEIRLAINGGRLDGRVQSLSPGRRATLLLAPSDDAGRSRVAKTAVSDAGGGFFMTGIAPGDYRLFAFEEVDVTELQDPAFLSSFEKNAAAVHFEAGAAMRMQVAVIPAELVSAQSTGGF